LNNLLQSIGSNVCSTNNGGCHSKATCINVIRRFACECNSGYSGDGYTCNGTSFPFFLFPLKFNIIFFLSFVF